MPRRARRRQKFADAHVSNLFSKLMTKDSIAVAQQVSRGLVKGKCLPQLLSRPLRGWVGSHIEMQNATAVRTLQRLLAGLATGKLFTPNSGNLSATSASHWLYTLRG